MAVRRDEFLRLGGLSEDYFYGHEDIDFTLRMRRAGGGGGEALPARRVAVLHGTLMSVLEPDGAVLAQVAHPPMGEGALLRFLTEDIVPAPIRQGDWAGLVPWLGMLMRTMVLPGLANTILVGQIALVVAGLVALVGMALPAPRVTGRVGALVGHLVLVVLRSFPEYMLAYLLMQAFGPSMLPAILALGLHNGAIIGHLLARQAVGRPLRPDAPRGATLWAWEYLPRLFGPFLALLLYRWEIILRETAIMGVLGIATLGFYLDDAIGELRMDRAMVILVATGLMSGTVEALSRRLRARTATASVRMG